MGGGGASSTCNARENSRQCLLPGSALPTETDDPLDGQLLMNGKALATVIASLALAVAMAGAPIACADGLASCQEDPVALGAEADAAIWLLASKGILGATETPTTVLQYVDETLAGPAPDVKTRCSAIISSYVTGRINGTIAPGAIEPNPTTEPNPTIEPSPKHVG